MDDTTDDLRLALLAGSGDREALNTLVDRARAQLFPVALAELGHYHDAEDAVASALVRICTGVGAIRNPAQVGPWMRAIVRNEARRLGARRRPDTPLDTDAPAADEVERTVLGLAVREALRRLPAQEGRALALFYWGGLSIREIADRVGRPEGTVKSWLHHGRRRLAREMGEQAMSTGDGVVIVGGNAAETSEWATALRRAGYGEAAHLTKFLDAASLVEGAQGATELHLPKALNGAALVLLNEWIEDRSAFEVATLLRATREREGLALGLLLEPRPEPEIRQTLLAAWVTGFDLVLTKPVVPAELERFGNLLRKRAASASP